MNRRLGAGGEPPAGRWGARRDLVCPVNYLVLGLGAFCFRFARAKHLQRQPRLGARDCPRRPGAPRQQQQPGLATPPAQLSDRLGTDLATALHVTCAYTSRVLWYVLEYHGTIGTPGYVTCTKKPGDARYVVLEYTLVPR